jgi:hypothetical protein
MDEYEEVAGLGILSGDAIKMHDTAKVRPNPSRIGIDILASCVYCGRENTITVEWTELVVVGLGRTPPNWQYDPEHGMWRPYLGCPSCKRPITAGLTPDECKKHVNSGIAAGSFQASQANAIAAQVTGQAQAQGQLARR